MDKNFDWLLDKYVTSSLTEQERQRFNNMLNDPAYQDRLEKIIDKELQEHAYEGREDAVILQAIQNKISININTERKPAKTISFYFVRIAVAAVFILLVGVGAFWIFNSANRTEEEQMATEEKRPAKDPMQPGGNRAILKLADGTEILLDSAASGTLAQQGQVKVIKLDDGKLSYASSGTSGELLYNIISTPKGGQYQLVLADGTKAWLNAASTLRFPASFSGDERVVELTGEGYFEVAKQAVPFHVKLHDLDIQVLGTHFNVNGYSDESAVRTTLLEGSVKVSKNGEEAMLKPGQQAVAGDKGNIALLDRVDTEKIVAWKNGLFQFQNTDIRTILREAARWYDLEFNFEGEISETFSGQIARSANASQLLKILESTDKVHFIVDGRTITVKP